MQKTHALNILAGLAASAALSTGALPAQAHSLSLAAGSDTHLVSAAAQSPVYFRAYPDARCLVGNGARALTVFANDDGFAHFNFQLGRGAAPSIRLLAACNAGNQHVTIPLALRAVPGPVSVARPPAVIDRAANAPREFNPVTASDAELARYDYPPRPDRITSPDAYADWLNNVSVPTVAIKPTEVLRPDVVHRTAQFNGTATSSNWSGEVAVGSNGQFTHAIGKWTVPAVSTTDQRSPAYSSLWVGLDGYTSNSNDVLQDGTEQDAVDYFGSSISSYSVWVEYVPDSGSVTLTNFDVDPGDRMYFSAYSCRNNQNQLRGCYHIIDYTKGERTNAIHAPNHQWFSGNSAEWIVERPTVNGNLYFLPDYNIAQTSDMGTYDTHLGQYVGYGAEPFDTVSMVNPNTKDLLSKSASLSRTTAQFTWNHYW